MVSARAPEGLRLGDPGACAAYRAREGRAGGGGAGAAAVPGVVPGPGLPAAARLRAPQLRTDPLRRLLQVTARPTRTAGRLGSPGCRRAAMTRTGPGPTLGHGDSERPGTTGSRTGTRRSGPRLPPHLGRRTPPPLCRHNVRPSHYGRGGCCTGSPPRLASRVSGARRRSTAKKRPAPRGLSASCPARVRCAEENARAEEERPARAGPRRMHTACIIYGAVY